MEEQTTAFYAHLSTLRQMLHLPEHLYIKSIEMDTDKSGKVLAKINIAGPKGSLPKKEIVEPKYDFAHRTIVSFTGFVDDKEEEQSA